ncbi:AraC family transcriptional regulator [Chitinophaga pendula]|uniref:AraC family transcriptional regulator n=1 Tax=Chitinophaga TaxID=79328 RepID=UPI000BAE9A54|nr:MULTISPECIES: AraC family transcriptional regulator [Chitinophaga]ASZ12872.1 AraC family transcriptional regulator [Chitinophaga sp. MD30]UCJ09496.1 AraC family transcriptional regulator [Chitinophaga pendula]
MEKPHLHQPVEIILCDLEPGHDPAHRHNFFEFVYVLSGTGHQCINKHKFAYAAGHMFLTTPGDCQSFDIVTATRFFLVRFNALFIRSGQFHVARQHRTEWLERLANVLQHASHDPGCILRHQCDKSLVRPLVVSIIREQENTALYNQELIQQMINTLIIIVVRNLAMNMPEKISDRTDDKALDILQYVQQHIYEPEKIRIEAISKYFGISESYLGRYFKKHANETLQQYITNYKLRLVEARLKYSDMRMNEIALELGFTDESHLNRIFKKYKGQNPSEYRKQFLQK